MKVTIFGARGYLGEHFRQIYPGASCPSVDIADTAAVAAVLDADVPDLVINAAGKTGRPNVDWCEDHKEETLRANVTGPLVLLNECRKRGIYWVHLSSGCIYSGDNGGGGFTEEDIPNFSGSFYSRTKTWSEQILKEFPDVLILRIRMPFDDSTNDRSLLMKVRKFAKVNELKNSLTYLPDFLEAAKMLIERRRSGIYNIVNPGPMSPYDIVELYKEIVDPLHQAERLSEAELSSVSKAARSNCILDTSKLEQEGIRLRSTADVVRHVWTELKGQLETK